MKFDPKGWAEETRLKFGVWKRERAERKAERQAQAYSEHGHGRFFLLTVPAVATILAAITEWYWAILFCIEATGAIDWNYETAAGTADREAAQAQIAAAADNARATIDALAASVDATPEQLNAAANEAQQAAQALAAAVTENGVAPGYGQAYEQLVAAVEAAQPADVAAATQAALAAVDATAATASENAPLLNPDIWNFAFSTHWPVFIGLICATIPIVMFSMVWLPVQFAMRGTGRIRRGSVIVVGLLANILVIVSGTVVMNYNRQEQVRADLVVEQTAEANRAMLTANVDDLRAELETLMNHRSTYVATAASVGAAAYERDYVAQARATNDPRLPLIERALGSARRADELRAEIREARQSVAAVDPAAASAANVEDAVGRELNTFAQYVEVWRPPFIALICTLIGIFGTWWVIAMLERMNPRDVLRSGWADEGHRIEDLRAQSAVVPEPMEPAREKIYDADTGEELVHRKATWAKKPKRKGKPEQVSMPGEERGPPVDRVVNADGSVTEIERGVRTDGGNRIAVGADGKGGVMESVVVEAKNETSADPEHHDGDQAANAYAQAPSAEEIGAGGVSERQHEQGDDARHQGHQDANANESENDASEHPEPSNLSEDDLAVLYPESAVAEPGHAKDEAAQDDAQNSAAQEEQEQNNTSVHTEPQFNPARLIAPVAAE